MEVLQPSTGLQTCSTYTTLHDTTVTTVTMGFVGKSQSLLMRHRTQLGIDLIGYGHAFDRSLAEAIVA